MRQNKPTKSLTAAEWQVLIFGLLTVLAVTFIFNNSLQGPEESNSRSGVIMRFLRSILDPHGKIPQETFHWFVRKAAHFSEFAALGFSLFGLANGIRRKWEHRLPGFVLFAALAVAVCDEFIQSFTGRTCSVRDVLIDFSGALCGILFSKALFIILQTIRKKRRSGTK